MDIELIDGPADLLSPAAELEAEATTELRAPARLLEFNRQRFVALPVHTTLEIVEQPEIIEVPGAPYYGLGMLRWQGRYLAVLNLCTLLNAYPKAGAARTRHALVVAYQVAPRRPIEYGAIVTVNLPQAIQVSDGMQCPLPADSDLWPLISISCFMHEGRPVPIVNPGRLFGAFLG